MKNIPLHAKSPSRRQFLKTSGAAGGALVIGFTWHGTAAEAATKSAPELAMNAFVRIDTAGRVTLRCHRSEMGQGVYTSMPMLIAEELEVPLTSVTVEMAPSAPPYVNAMLGGQITGGSSSVREAYVKLREAGAAARMMLISAAAQSWGVAEADCRAVDGTVVYQKKKLFYGQLVTKAAKLPVPEKPALKDAKDFKVIGKQFHRLDTAAKVHAKAEFGIDVKKPGMLVASLAQAPVIGGKVVKFDDSKARALKGVVKVVQIPDGVAVLAKDFYTAKKGRDLLEIEWDNGPVGKLDMAAIRAGLREASTKPGAVIRKEGDVAAAMMTAAKKITAEYELPYLAHATLEPVNCTAEIVNGECHITGPIQFQQGAHGAAAAASGIAPEKTFIHTTFLGGGYGRKLELDFIAQSAAIAKVAGVPVKLLWTREDDMTHDFYRPLSLHQLEAGLDDKGNLVALSTKMTSQSITARAFPPFVQNGIDPFMNEGAGNLTYKPANLRIESVIHDSGIRVGYWRSVSNALNAFAIESFIDEIAKETGKDPLAMRLAMLDAHPRAQAVLKLAADKAGWGKSASGRFLGIAQMECYDTYSAVVAEVSVANGKPTVHRLVCATDCGIMVHPDQVNAQLESGLLLGYSSAMKNEITFKDGRPEQSNFDNYPMLRMSETPLVEIHMIASGNKPGGIGEVGVPLAAPAIANAIAAATGKRIRKMPLLSA
ncbi:MAG: xanthine dehydrogenase family protein molybdopterin-binding subunit [Betaproteobacteria bacterium]|nr:xanthine dehydrogenase family protein molybdopterin-binding subunit [Betaproteobacteria bacterium]